MKCYIHIGATKTGSSALQRGLYKNSALKAAGYCYPDVGIASAAQHLTAACLHPGAKGLHRDFFAAQSDAPHEVFRTLVNESLREARNSDAHTVILSSEYLWGAFDASLYDQWIEAFDGFQLEVIAYLRPLKQWFMSSYLQAVKNGEARSFADWLSATSRNASSGTSPAAVISPWRERLGSECLHLIKYSTSQSSDIVHDFSQHFLAGVLPKSDTMQINPSPGAEAINILLEINRSDISNSNKSKLRTMVMRDCKKKPQGTPFDIEGEGAVNIDDYVSREEDLFVSSGFPDDLIKDDRA